MSTETPTKPTMPKWRVMPIPEGSNKRLKNDKNEEENTGGVVVYVGTSNAQKVEIGRVAYLRRLSSHPKTGFDAQLKRTTAIADAVVKEINERLEAEAETVETEALALIEQLRKQASDLEARLNSVAEEIIKKIAAPNGELL